RQVLEEFEHNEIIYEYDDLEDEELIEVTSAPIVRLLNSIVEQAVRNKASDIHVEPYSNEVRIRIRVDGDLQKIMTLPKNNLSPIITRIKIIGKMNIAEKRIPQDGRVETIINGKEIDMRISTLPTVYGEKAVIRLLDKAGLSFTKESLGFNTENLKVFNEILYQPYGMILVTGPTGSGKTTTLYTALRELNTMEKNIITVEDPVEYKLDGINQVQVNAKAGLTFATGLRSILRQDPDIIMIGEIRDSETAEMAIRAAITGHLVLSTLHTNDSPSAVARLVDMGVEPYLVSSAVIGIMSQRLIKVLCNNCKKAYEASYAEKKFLNYPVNQDLTLYSAIGCNTCNQGYRGRVGVHEIMPIDAKMRRLIDENVNIEDLREAAIKSGMVPLTEAVMNLAIEGRTSFDEVVKVGFTL
ncbi:MAG TPA: GspE/PulE family protein, partial [Tissierellaceae bacterium]|nr:GspE/PulE family protein [Tissierellaceae bacterium]